jgi:cytochrome c oxidase cbb3-type subunit 3
VKHEDQDQVRGHDFDGIQEYDNRLPNWWLFTLYGAVVFAVGYWILFHTSALGTLPYGQYVKEMAKAAELQLSKMSGEAPTDESLSLVAAIPERVQAGRAIFEQFCVTCHLADASGQVGPNLTDEYWLHGGKPTQILGTVTNGVLEKGMAAWGNQLGPRRVQDVVAYVLSLKGTNRPGKAPQGVLETAGEGAPGGGEKSTEASAAAIASAPPSGT